jgi:hypothetical protein
MCPEPVEGHVIARFDGLSIHDTDELDRLLCALSLSKGT